MITVPPASGKYENRGSRPPTEKLTYRQIPCGSRARAPAASFLRPRVWGERVVLRKTEERKC